MYNTSLSILWADVVSKRRPSEDVHTADVFAFAICVSFLRDGDGRSLYLSQQMFPRLQLNVAFRVAFRVA